jgi:hypothetical protein
MNEYLAIREAYMDGLFTARDVALRLHEVDDVCLPNAVAHAHANVTRSGTRKDYLAALALLGLAVAENA